MIVPFVDLLVLCASSASAFPHQHGPLNEPASSAPYSIDVDVALEEARQLVERGQTAMAHANHAIISEPRRNRLEVLNSTELARAWKPPAPLDYHGNIRSLNVTHSYSPHQGAEDETGKDFRYTVPDDLVRAAQLVSENWTPSEQGDGLASAASEVQHNHGQEHNGSNQTPASLQYGSRTAVANSNPDIVDLSRRDGRTHELLQRRNANEWWMATMAQRGSSPFAPSGYKVWRNVKDFGAKGDGVADDTAAINSAISSGGRCGGGDCTGSTIYPATVYFPPGTYKVSRTIIQYYNTELLGNPFELPTILAAPSFIGLGVIASNVYMAGGSEWYLNTNNFLRSIRNFVIDLRSTRQRAEISGIHWQVAQGSSLENIHFHMTKPKDNPRTTQKGIFMENGSGGFMSDLHFVGGKIGAWMGNQQFTASGLHFEDAETAMQIHWDWGWTMQDIVIENCQVGLSIVGPTSESQGVGSLHMTDSRMSNVHVGISWSVISDKSTALLLSNSEFDHVDIIAKDAGKGQILLVGGPETIKIDTWGLGKVTGRDGVTSFSNGTALASSPIRQPSLTKEGGRHFFTKRRPKYHELKSSQIIDARAYGASGDGITDDTAVLNHIFATAVNMSAVVYLPFGVYLIKDTVHIPVGSRIVGQAWAQIMATGPKFADALLPRVAVRVGSPGEAGVVEIQSMMVTVKGATAGAVLMEWNVHESSQGSAGLWDTHFRVGGATGSDLTVNDCPKLSGKVNDKCIAASLMVHLTPQSSAYFENVWMWTADHDIDTDDQDQIDVYVGRGLLVESKGPTWLWGTAVEHCVLYQYQLSGAENVVMGLIQTESPYYQSTPASPAPFSPGDFPYDPEFTDCSSESTTCGVSWAVRILGSSSIQVLSAGLYSFFSRYDQTCINSGRGDCQDKILYVDQRSDVRIYNLVTAGSVEMISPAGGIPTLAQPNKNGFGSSILAWASGPK